MICGHMIWWCHVQFIGSRIECSDWFRNGCNLRIDVQCDICVTEMIEHADTYWSSFHVRSTQHVLTTETNHVPVLRDFGQMVLQPWTFARYFFVKSVQCSTAQSCWALNKSLVACGPNLQSSSTTRNASEGCWASLSMSAHTWSCDKACPKLPRVRSKSLSQPATRKSNDCHSHMWNQESWISVHSFFSFCLSFSHSFGTWY